MSITIPETVRYSSRDYDIGTVIELDDSKKSDIDNHPLFKLMLQFIASPFSDENYDDIEDNLKYFLKPSFMAKAAEQDSDIIFDEDEYREHVNYAWDALQKLTAEELLLKLRQYVGNYEQINAALDSGLLDEGKSVKISEVNEEIQTDHLLSAHSKGIESKKIFQAADKKVKYPPALKKVKKYTTIEVSNKTPTKISLPRSKHPMTLDQQSYIINVDFEGLFNELFMEAGINPMPIKGGQQSTPKPRSSTQSSQDTQDALEEAMAQAKKVKKSLEFILKEETEDDKLHGEKEGEEYDYTRIQSYKTHKDFQLNDEAEELVKTINLKVRWNKLLSEGEFKYEDEVSEGDLDAQEIVAQLREGQMKETEALANEMVDKGAMTQDAYDRFIDEGKIPGRRGFNKKEKELIQSNVNFKSNLNPPIGRTEFEQALYTKEVASNIRTVSNRVKPIVHSKKRTKSFFKNETWDTPDKLEIDLENGATNSIKLKRMLDIALIPKTVGTLRITLIVVHGSDEEKESREKMVQEEDDDDIVTNSKYLLERVWDVFRLEDVQYIAKTEYSFKDWVERKPEYRSMSNPKAQKLKLPDYAKPKNPLRGRLDEGGQPTYINVKTNTILYYIKKQVAELDRVMK